MNRLTNANSANQTFNAVYAYDGDGHMTSSSMNNVIASTPRMLNSHRISSYGGNTIEYDNKGNVTYEGLTGWRTNEFNRNNLPLNMTNGTMGYTFRYNDKGERTNKNFSNGTETKNEYYLNDYLGRTLAIYEDGRIKEGIINGNDVIGEIEVGVEKDNRYYYLKDHLGSVRVVLESPSSTVVSATDFGPYGETLRQMNDSIDVRYDYTGKEKDKETGDRYFGARYLGVLPFWKSVDPLAEKYPGWSPYNYTLCSPMRFVDPNGTYVDDYTTRLDGTIEVKKTNDKVNNYYLETAPEQIEYVMTLEKNEQGLVQIPSSFQTSVSYGDGMSYKFGWSSHTSDAKRYVSGEGMAALIGVAFYVGAPDLSIGQFSYASGASPAPSKSHIAGRNGDIRPLRTDYSGDRVTVYDSQFDMARNTTLVEGFKYFGWKDILSHDDLYGRRVPGTRNAKNHSDHFHIQGFNPKLIRR